MQNPSFNRFNLLLILIITPLVACTTTPQKVAKDNGPPAIKNLLDLGSLDISPNDSLPKNRSDKLFMPGEWVHIDGKNLNDISVAIDGISSHVQHRLNGEALVRIPAGLSPLKTHEMTVTNQFGSATKTLKTQHYIIVTDTDGQTTHFIPTSADEKGGINPVWKSLDIQSPLYNLVTPDSRFALIISIADKKSSGNENTPHAYIMKVSTVHLAAPNTPEIIREFKFSLSSSPTGASLSNDGKLVLLGTRSFTLIDARDALQLQQLSSFELPITASDKKNVYVDVIFRNNNQQLVLVETWHNQVALVDISNTSQPKLQHTVNVFPDSKLPLCTDLEIDPKNQHGFWLVTGTNFRQTGKLIRSGFKKLTGRLSDEESAKQGKSGGLQYINIQEHQLTLGKNIPGPKNFAVFFATGGNDGRLYLSGGRLDFILQRSEDESSINPKELAKSLWDSLAIGRIVAIDPQTEQTETISKGVGIYYSLVDVPDIGPVFSLMKMGNSIMPPFVNISWGMGIKTTGTYAKRKMKITTLAPPYSLGHVAFQY